MQQVLGPLNIALALQPVPFSIYIIYNGSIAALRAGTLTQQGLDLLNIVPVIAGRFLTASRDMGALPPALPGLLATCHGLSRLEKSNQLVRGPLCMAMRGTLFAAGAIFTAIIAWCCCVTFRAWPIVLYG